MGFLAKLIEKGAEVGGVALVASARAAEMRAPKKHSKRKQKTAADCTACAATKTAVKMYNATWKGTAGWGGSD